MASNRFALRLGAIGLLVGGCSDTPSTPEVVVLPSGVATVEFRSPTHIKIDTADSPYVVVVPPIEPLRVKYTVPLGEAFTIHAVDIFIGQDRGDRVESEVNVFTSTGQYLASYVLEKETEGISERRPRIDLPTPVTTSSIDIHILSRVTGSSLTDNPSHSSYKKWRGVMDWNVVLVGTNE